MKNDEFCGKTFKFLPKICLCLFKYKGVKPTSMSNKICKYVENEISNSISHKNKKQKKKEKERGAKTFWSIKLSLTSLI